MFVLKLEDVIRETRKAHAEGRLLAQHPDPMQRKCMYSHDGRCCPLGAAMPPELIEKLKTTIVPDSHPGLDVYNTYNNMSVERLMKDGLVEVSRDEIEHLEYIQNAHDNWTSDGKKFWKSGEETFLKSLEEGWTPPDYELLQG